MSRRATAAGEERKGPYQHFAWRDAISLASLLMDTFEPRRILELFRSFSYIQLRDLEKRWRIEVAELIEKTERPAELRRLAREHPAEQAAELVLLFAIMGQ